MFGRAQNSSFAEAYHRSGQRVTMIVPARPSGNGSFHGSDHVRRILHEGHNLVNDTIEGKT